MGMKNLITAVILFMPAALFAAVGPVALGPNQGKYGDWTAAVYGSGGAKTCYAFTRATHSDPALPGRGTVMLTVTERAGAHDEVTLSAGYSYPPKAEVKLTVGDAKIAFYTSGGNAFTIHGAEAIAAFRNGSAAQAQSSAPHGHKVKDEFSLSGFSGAYGAIASACP
jgi:invasion protein IalB